MIRAYASGALGRVAFVLLLAACGRQEEPASTADASDASSEAGVDASEREACVYQSVMGSTSCVADAKTQCPANDRCNSCTCAFDLIAMKPALAKSLNTGVY